MGNPIRWSLIVYCIQRAQVRVGRLVYMSHPAFQEEHFVNKIETDPEIQIDIENGLPPSWLFSFLNLIVINSFERRVRHHQKFENIVIIKYKTKEKQREMTSNWTRACKRIARTKCNAPGLKESSSSQYIYRTKPLEWSKPQDFCASNARKRKIIILNERHRSILYVQIPIL